MGNTQGRGVEHADRMRNSDKLKAGTMILTVTIRDDNGQSVGVLVLNPKDFASGSRGFFGTGKVAIEGKRYQCQAQVIEIGSKGAGVAESKAE